MPRKKSGISADRLGRLDGMTPAAIYARVSSEAQDVENSIDAQIKQCREWAERNCYFVVKEFTDRAKSGRADNRPNFREMIEEAGRLGCQFEAVIVWKFSRFFRDRTESAFYKGRLMRYGVRVISINEPVDDSPVGKLTEGVLEAIDGFQSDSIGEDVRRGTRNLAGRGFFLGRSAPHGMMKVSVQDGSRVRHKLAPDPNFAPDIRRIFDLALQERTEGQIRSILDEEGIPNAGGRRWESRRVHEVLNNRHYAGTVVWGKSSKKEGPAICPNAHEGIVTPEEFERVQALLKARAPEVANPRHSGGGRLLSGLVRCRQCPGHFNYTPAGRDGRKYSYLVCSNRKHQGARACSSPWLPTEKFEPLVIRTILENILTRENISLAIEELRAETGDANDKTASRLQQIESRLQDVKGRMKRLYFAYENGDIEYEAFSERNQQLRDLKGKIEADRERTGTATADLNVILDNPEAVLAHLEKVNDFLRIEEPSRCRSWLKTFVKCLWIEPGRATVEYSIPLPVNAPSAHETVRFIDMQDAFPPSTRVGPLRRE